MRTQNIRPRVPIRIIYVLRVLVVCVCVRACRRRINVPGICIDRKDLTRLLTI